MMENTLKIGATKTAAAPKTTAGQTARPATKANAEKKPVWDPCALYF